VFESTNKAVIAQYFLSKKDTAAAFANTYFWVGLTAAFGVTVFDSFQETSAASVGLVLIGEQAVNALSLPF
jgi:hypothetical protein